MSAQGSVPPKLEPQSLYTEQEKRDALKLKTYNNLLEQAHNKIKTASRLPNNDKSIVFQVPEFVMGVPRFSTRDCILYMVWNLRQSNFDVQYYHPNIVWISWKRHDVKYKEEQNPIVQVMRNAIAKQEEQVNKLVEQPKPAIKKTTQQYIAPPTTGDTTRKVTFI
jgi:hypothetical protein